MGQGRSVIPGQFGQGVGDRMPAVGFHQCPWSWGGGRGIVGEFVQDVEQGGKGVRFGVGECCAVDQDQGDARGGRLPIEGLDR